jgi:hypothetical protein
VLDKTPERLDVSRVSRLIKYVIDDIQTRVASGCGEIAGNVGSVEIHDEMTLERPLIVDAFACSEMCLPRILHKEDRRSRSTTAGNLGMMIEKSPGLNEFRLYARIIEDQISKGLVDRFTGCHQLFIAF